MRRGTGLLAPDGLRTSTRPVAASAGTEKARRVGRLMSTCADTPSTSTAGASKPWGPSRSPRSSISPKGSAAAGTMSSMRGSRRAPGAGWAGVRGMSNPDYNLEPDAQQSCYTPSIQPSGHIIEYDSPSFGEAFKLTDGRRLGHVEETEEDQGDKSVAKIERASEESDPLTGYLIDDDDLGIFSARLAGDDGRGGDTDQERQGDAGDEDEEKGVGRGVEETGIGGT